MKTLLSILVILLSSTAFAQGGAMGGGGGQYVSARFVKYVRFAMMAMKDPSEKFFTQQEATSIESAIDLTQVFNEPNDYFCDSYQDVITGTVTKHCEDAHYYSDLKTIKVNQDTWPKLSCMDKMQSVLHEYGRAAGLENANYAFSSKVHLSRTFRDTCTFIVDQENKEEQSNGQSEDDHCTENVKALINSLSLGCFKHLREIPSPATSANQQLKKSELHLEFDRCMQDTSEEWLAGIGKKCSRQLTQSECINLCKNEGFFDYCLIPCSKF